MKETVLAFDRNLFLLLNGDGGSFMDACMAAFSSKLMLVPIGLLALWMIWRKEGWRRLLLAIGCIALIVLFADQISGFFKHNLPKFRPTHDPLLAGMVHTVNGYKGGLYGTVSAHAANSFGVSLFAALLVHKRWFSWIIFICCLLIVYSRIYLGVHFPLDIFFGTLLGLLTGYLFYLLYKKLEPFVPTGNSPVDSSLKSKIQ